MKQWNESSDWSEIQILRGFVFSPSGSRTNLYASKKNEKLLGIKLILTRGVWNNGRNSLIGVKFNFSRGFVLSPSEVQVHAQTCIQAENWNDLGRKLILTRGAWNNGMNPLIGVKFNFEDLCSPFQVHTQTEWQNKIGRVRIPILDVSASWRF